MPPDTANAEKKQTREAQKRAKVSKVPGVQMDIPLGKELVIRIPRTEQSYRGKMVGVDPYDYGIASVRLPAVLRKKLKFGGQVIIKYVHQGNVFGFRTNVLNVVSTPAALLFFEFPDIIEKIALRNSSRMMCNIDGIIETIEDKFECMVVNVSESGCRISARAGSRDPLTKTKVGETMVVSMTLGHFGTVKTPIAIRNVSIEKGIINMGAMFLDINKEEVTIIQKYLDKIERFTR